MYERASEQIGSYMLQGWVKALDSWNLTLLYQ